MSPRDLRAKGFKLTSSAGDNDQGFAATSTERLLLTRASVNDLEPLAALHADERVWQHLPSGRHRSTEETRSHVLEYERQWRDWGLGYWVARLRAPHGQLAAGQVAGIGGCAVPDGKDWWNLYYRFTPEAHGFGLATELSAVAIDAAHHVDQQRPVVAFLLEHNHGSRATAERAGLTQMWRGHDAGNPDPEAIRLIFADRPLDNERLGSIIAQH